MSSQQPDRPEWIPRVDVYVTRIGDLNILAELGPLRREDVELDVDGDGLRIKGRRPNHDGHCGSRYLVKELRWGAFERVVTVPSGFDLPMATASYQSGLLRIVVPARRG